MHGSYLLPKSYLIFCVRSALCNKLTSHLIKCSLHKWCCVEQEPPILGTWNVHRSFYWLSMQCFLDTYYSHVYCCWRSSKMDPAQQQRKNKPVFHVIWVVLYFLLPCVVLFMVFDLYNYASSLYMLIYWHSVRVSMIKSRKYFLKV